MKLNIGSSHPKGKYRHEPWINIDVAADEVGMSNVLKVDALEMSKKWQNEFDEIHAVHVLEHINRNYRAKFVSECYRVLKPGGVLYIEVPDFEQVVRALVDAWDFQEPTLAHNMTTSIFGKQRYIGDQHCWGFTENTLSILIHEAFGHKPTIHKNMDVEQMISGHYTQEPVLLARVEK
jgi:predicted SAM-dependent methyltransferase